MQKRLTTTYVALGGNMGEPITTLNHALDALEKLPQVLELEVSSFYSTKAISVIPQPDYINAVCRFKTSFSAMELLIQLQKIESQLGKESIIKDAPRTIDLDIILFGLEMHRTPVLQIPHPRWKQRLFVLAPLGDLARQLAIPDEREGVEIVDLSELIWEFPNPHEEYAIELPDRRIPCKKCP